MQRIIISYYVFWQISVLPKNNLLNIFNFKLGMETMYMLEIRENIFKMFDIWTKCLIYLYNGVCVNIEAVD